MKIKDIPSIEQPIERLFRYGSDKLTSCELLAIILGSGTKQYNAIELSKKLMKYFPDNRLSDATVSDLKICSGIGKAKAARIAATFELGKRLLKHKRTTFVLKPKDVWKELESIRMSTKEHFIIFYLDVRNQVIKKDIISIGILNSSIVHPREVFESAVKSNTAQILLSHNHPSGDPSPSEDDIVLTKRLIEAGNILGIEVIDHVIVSSKKWYSFKQYSLI